MTVPPHARNRPSALLAPARPGRARHAVRRGVAGLLLPTVLLAVAGCSGDDGDPAADPATGSSESSASSSEGAAPGATEELPLAAPCELFDAAAASEVFGAEVEATGVGSDTAAQRNCDYVGTAEDAPTATFSILELGIPFDGYWSTVTGLNQEPEISQLEIEGADEARLSVDSIERFGRGIAAAAIDEVFFNVTVLVPRGGDGPGREPAARAGELAEAALERAVSEATSG